MARTLSEIVAAHPVSDAEVADVIKYHAVCTGKLDEWRVALAGRAAVAARSGRFDAIAHSGHLSPRDLISNIEGDFERQRSVTPKLIEINANTFGNPYARFLEFSGKIEERIAQHNYDKLARPPLDFAKEILPANAEPTEQVSPGQLDERNTAARLGPFATEDGNFVKSRKRIARFPHIKQIDEMDCGAASLAMVCRHFGRKVSISRIRQAVHTATDGTSLRGLCQGAESLGLAARSVKASKSNVGQMPLPAIIHWENYHWVVLYNATDRHAWIADPATSIRKITREESRKVERVRRAVRLYGGV